MPAAFVFCVCQTGAEPAVAEELARTRPGLRRAYARPGLITFKSDVPVDADLRLGSVFTRAYGASLGPAATVADVAAAARTTCPEGQPVRLHVFERDVARPGEEPPGHIYGPRAAAARAELLAAWPPDAPPLRDGERAEPGDLVLDVIVAAGEPWWLGVHRHGPHHSPWPGGRLHVDMPPEAPSRAYRKLEEALLWSGAPVRAGDVAVEIGSSPGGASYALLRRGVTVHGIDPAKMADVVLDFNKDDPAANHFVHLHRPMSMVRREDLPRELHWVLLDVNLAPQVALITARRLAARPRAALMGVILTLKLDDWKAVRHVPKLLKSIESMGMAEVRATQLPSNRMELCVVGLTDRGLQRMHAPV